MWKHTRTIDQQRALPTRQGRPQSTFRSSRLEHAWGVVKAVVNTHICINLVEADAVDRAAGDDVFRVRAEDVVCAVQSDVCPHHSEQHRHRQRRRDDAEQNGHRINYFVLQRSFHIPRELQWIWGYILRRLYSEQVNIDTPIKKIIFSKGALVEKYF